MFNKFVRRLPRFVEADREIPLLADHESWTREKIDCYKLEKINQMWEHAIAFVPHYRQLYHSQRLPDHFHSLAHFRESVPTLSKNEVRSDSTAFRSSVINSGFWRRTGGSTGAPTKVFWGHDAHLAVLRTKYRALKMWNVDYLDRIAFLWGHSNTFQPGVKGRVARLRQPVEDCLRNRLRLSAYQIGPDRLSSYLKQLKRFRPVAIYGYPTAIELLARQAERENVVLDSLRLVVATGEPVLKSLVDSIEAVFKSPTINEYGSVECGHIAHEWPDRSLRVREDVIDVETIERDDLCHEIVVTPFLNLGFPLIRYQIQDTSSGPLQFPAAGFAQFRDVMGRSNDFLVAKDGEVIHSARLDAFFKYECSGVRRFRVHQHDDGRIDVQLELETENETTKFDVEQRVFNIVEYPVKVQVVDQIELSDAGKHRLLVSDMARNRFDRVQVPQS